MLQLWYCQVLLSCNKNYLRTITSVLEVYIRVYSTTYSWEPPLEKEILPRILAWGIPWTEEAGGLQSMMSQTVRHTEGLSMHTHMHSCVTES